MRLVVDVENTITKREKKNILDPFEPGLELVQVGMQNVDNIDETYLFTLNHKEDQDVGGSRAKNKLKGGWHGTVHCELDGDRSQYLP